MSYSIYKKAPTKEAARAAIEEEFKAVVLASQPMHEKDRAAAFANVDAHLALTDEPKENEEVHISMNGSISWTVLKFGDESVSRFTHAGSGCSISITEAAKAPV